MENLILKTHKKEESMLRSLENFDRRFSEDIELSDLISGFKNIFFNLFKFGSMSSEEKDNIYNILNYCIDKIKIEYKRTKNLNNLEFFVWHLSMFMTIQSFMKIVELKYNLKRKDEIEVLFDELLTKEFLKFTELNSKIRDIKNITRKLLTKFEYEEKNIFIGVSKGNIVLEDSYVLTKFDREEGYAIKISSPQIKKYLIEYKNKGIWKKCEENEEKY